MLNGLILWEEKEVLPYEEKNKNGAFSMTPADDLIGMYLLIENEVIVDCIDIYKQPAFNHPLLKNHKIQVSWFYKTKEIYGLQKFPHTAYSTQGSRLSRRNSPHFKNSPDGNLMDTRSSRSATYGFGFNSIEYEVKYSM
ncbi:hypothetical protein WN944_000544 [Citrus x changshan-huyou]|uniref:Neprosin activation peptide domain-containing protein n=1 Tax=Citrus x changshan-huyou TaxID=2935761 RepID=A0AAP0MET9_9ROSI